VISIFNLNTIQKILKVSVVTALAVGTSATFAKAEPTAQDADLAAVGNEIQLYGQVPEPNQIRQGYLVFQRQGDLIVGAYYEPRSEFSCFVGEMSDRELDIDFLSSQRQEASEAEIQLSDLYALASPSANDQRILNVCREQILVSSR
jgi:hypothetical protein